MQKIITVSIILVILFLASFIHAKDIIVPLDNYPPFQILPENGSPPYGEVISILKAIVDNVNQKNGYDLRLVFTKDTPFKRCLGMMQSGKADLIGGILDKDDRKGYMHLLKYKLNSNKMFLLRKDEPKDFQTLEDLSGYSVGTVLGYSYFKEFDANPKIKKDLARNLLLSLEKLKNKRFDVVICSEAEWEALKENNLKLASNFKPATLKYSWPNPVHIGISKKSWLGRSNYLQAFEKSVQEMYNNKEFLKIIDHFYQSYGPRLKK